MKEEENPIGNSDCPYSWLNEWLCEYVDGTMDPSLRRVFDTYVEANPDLKAHVERLRHTRQLLCACSRDATEEVPENVRAQVQAKIEGDMLRTPYSLREAIQERPVAAFASTLIVALVVGMFTGATLFAPQIMPTQTSPTVRSTPSYERPSQRESASSTAYRMRATTLPNAAPSASFHSLMEYNTGMPYTTDSTSDVPMQHAPFVVRP